jgi:hypothetical protein
MLIDAPFFSCRTFVRKLEAPKTPPCAGDPMCLGVGEVPLLKNIRTGLIDPDTPDSAKSITATDGTEWQLVVRCLANPSTENRLTCFISSPTSSTQMGVLSMMATILTFKGSIFGMALRRIWRCVCPI